MTVESTAAARKPRRSSGTKRAGVKRTPQPKATEPQLVQLLTPEGERVQNDEYDGYVADITPETLRGLYRDMVLTRRFDAEATSLQRQGELACGPRCSARRPPRSAPDAR